MDLTLRLIGASRQKCSRVSAAPLYAHERQSQRDCHDEERNTCAEFYFFLFRYAPSVYETYPEAFCYSREARAERYTSAVVKCCTPHKETKIHRLQLIVLSIFGTLYGIDSHGMQHDKL